MNDIIEAHKASMVLDEIPLLEDEYALNELDFVWQVNYLDNPVEKGIEIMLEVKRKDTNEILSTNIKKVFDLYE